MPADSALSTAAADLQGRRITRRRLLAGLSALGLWPALGRSAWAQEAEYRRPFGDLAPWNVPVARLPEHANSRELVDRLFVDLGGPRNTRFHLTMDSHTYTVFDATINAVPTPIKTYWAGNLTGKIPWNTMWKVPESIDARVIVLDEPNGLEWDLSGAAYKLQVVRAAHANLVPGDYRTKTDGFVGSRGSGLPFLAMLVRPAEIRAGVIRHALSMSVANISNAEFVTPATKMDFGKGGRGGVPAGTRFALRATDEELQEWAARLPPALSERTRETARILAVALRDYGWFVTDTSPGNLFHLESRASAGAEWEALGLTDQKVRRWEFPRDLIDGLLTPDRLVTYVASDNYPAEFLPR